MPRYIGSVRKESEEKGQAKELESLMWKKCKQECGDGIGNRCCRHAESYLFLG